MTRGARHTLGPCRNPCRRDEFGCRQGRAQYLQALAARVEPATAFPRRREQMLDLLGDLDGAHLDLPAPFALTGPPRQPGSIRR